MSPLKLSASSVHPFPMANPAKFVLLNVPALIICTICLDNVGIYTPPYDSAFQFVLLFCASRQNTRTSSNVERSADIFGEFFSEEILKSKRVHHGNFIVVPRFVPVVIVGESDTRRRFHVDYVTNLVCKIQIRDLKLCTLFHE